MATYLFSVEGILQLKPLQNSSEHDYDGSFDGNMGTFYCMDVLNGKEILVKFQWDKNDPSMPVWSQAFSPDYGKTWEWNWYMTFTRQSSISSLG